MWSSQNSLWGKSKEVVWVPVATHLKCVNINHFCAYESIPMPFGDADHLTLYLRSSMTFNGYFIFCPNCATNLHD